MSSKRKARDKRFYVNEAKKKRMSQYHLMPDSKGFLLFCNRHEKEAIREAYKLLNEYADQNETSNMPEVIVLKL